MFHASCTVYYPDQQMHKIYINNVLYIVSTPESFNLSPSSSGSLNLYFAKVTKLLKLEHNKIGRLKCSPDYCCKTLIIITRGSWFGGRIYSLDSLVGVIPMLVSLALLGL
jgi:hypothetical protein